MSINFVNRNFQRNVSASFEPLRGCNHWIKLQKIHWFNKIALTSNVPYYREPFQVIQGLFNYLL